MFCVTLSENTAYFITVLCKIFMQIFNLFLYHENAGVLWIFVKVLNRTVFTVIIYVTCHLQGYLEISSCNYVVHDRSLNRLSYLYLLNAVLLPVCMTISCQTCIPCNANCYRSNNSVVKDTTVQLLVLPRQYSI